MTDRSTRAEIAPRFGRSSRHLGPAVAQVGPRRLTSGNAWPGIHAPALAGLMTMAMVTVNPGLNPLASRTVVPRAAGAEPAAGRGNVHAQMVVRTREGLRPAARAELELVRSTCGSLAKESRPAIVAAAEQGLTRAAEEFSDRQRNGRGSQGFDARQAIHDVIASALEPLVPAAEFAAYQREHAARLARRMRTARLRIIGTLTAALDLSASQMAAIEADLQRRWQPGWLAALDDNGQITNGLRLAPDFAAEAIAPHLDERQRAAWDDWCRQAPMSSVRFLKGWEGRSLDLDPWWQP